jgi:polysaccharide export outer membrane protein
MAGAGVGTSQIGPGDLVEITIVSGSGEERVLPVPARVAQDGTVMVPLVGGVSVGGLEPVAAEQRIAAAAIERGIYRQPYVTLTVKEPAVNRVTVLGAVAKPGVVELPRGSSDLASALAAAGGMSKEAGTRIEVLRRGRTFLAENSTQSSGNPLDGVRLATHTSATQSTDMQFGAPAPLDQSAPPAVAMGPHSADVTRIDLAQAGPAAPQNHKLDDRDVVMVLPQEMRVIHVTGLVKKPDQFQWEPDKSIRVLDAIAMAGGTTSPVADKVFVIRQLPDMPAPAVIKVSMSGAKRNGEENLVLAAGDLISVESTMSTMTLETLSKFFRIALGVNGRIAAF